MFRVAREDAIRQICEKLKQKLNEFLELETYEWTLVEPKGHASSFISDIIAFLQTTFHSFTDLPVSSYFGNVRRQFTVRINIRMRHFMFVVHHIIFDQHFQNTNKYK